MYQIQGKNQKFVYFFCKNILNKNCTQLYIFIKIKYLYMHVKFQVLVKIMYPYMCK